MQEQQRGSSGCSRRRRRAAPMAAAAAMAAAAMVALLVVAALPRPASAAPVANIQSIHGCDCIGVCDRGSAGRWNTPTCYVNVSSCECVRSFC
jgi:hypothetical protein